MNQQRSRRFRAAQEEQLRRDEEEKAKSELEKAGHVFPEKDERLHFDSNCIVCLY